MLKMQQCTKYKQVKKQTIKPQYWKYENAKNSTMPKCTNAENTKMPNHQNAKMPNMSNLETAKM